MAVITVETSDTFEEWRVKTNQIASESGDLDAIYVSPTATVGVPQNTQPGDVILALNNLESRKLNNLNATLNGTTTVNGNMDITGAYDLTVGGDITGATVSGDGAGLTDLNGSNVSSGTVAAARLGAGTTDTTTYLRGDGNWTPIASIVTAAENAAIVMSIALG